jgi:hypothetical protein
MKNGVLAGMVATAAVLNAPTLDATERPECAQLTTLQLPDVKVTEAVAVPASAKGPITVAHCRVAGVIGTEIKQPFGGEGELVGWPLWITGAPPKPGQPQAPSLRFAFGTQLFKYLVFNDPDWDYTKYDLSTWKSDTKRTASFLNATNPDLDAFRSKGHKLLLWHGWSDAALSALGTIK